MQKKISRTIFNKSRSDHVKHLFESYEIKTVYDLFFDQLFTEALCQYFKISCIKLNIWDDLLQNNQRITRNSSRGLFKPFKHRTKTKEKSLNNSIRKALNFLLDHGLLENFPSTVTCKDVKREMKNTLKVYIKDNATLVSLFFT